MVVLAVLVDDDAERVRVLKNSFYGVEIAELCSACCGNRVVADNDSVFLFVVDAGSLFVAEHGNWRDSFNDFSEIVDICAAVKGGHAAVGVPPTEDFVAEGGDILSCVIDSFFGESHVCGRAFLCVCEVNVCDDVVDAVCWREEVAVAFHAFMCHFCEDCARHARDDFGVHHHFRECALRDAECGFVRECFLVL